MAVLDRFFCIRQVVLLTYMLSYLEVRLEASILAEPYFDCASREGSRRSARLQLVTKDHVLTHIEVHVGNCKYSAAL